MTPEQYHAVAARSEPLATPDEVETACDRMAAEIAEAVGDRDPVVLCVMTGGIVVTGLLLPRLPFPLRLDYVHATRYRGATRGGRLHWLHRPATAIRGEHVLIIDDIFDEGLTMEAIVAACRDDGARGIHSAVLVEKDRPRDCRYRPDIIGLKLPNRYVMGYGLDYRDYFRNAAGIHAAAPADC
jgi:hypoxanthine phosphoribosyltransferase